MLDQHPERIALLRDLGQTSGVTSRSPRRGLGADQHHLSRLPCGLGHRLEMGHRSGLCGLEPLNRELVLFHAHASCDRRPRRIYRADSRVCDDAHR